MRGRPYTYLLTSVTEGRRAFFQKPEHARLLVAVLWHYRDANAYKLHAFVVMPEHFHALITPSENYTIEKCAQLVKGGFAFQSGRKGIWQRGFNQQGIRDAEHFEAERCYVEENPAEAGLVAWPFVSSRYAGNLDPLPEFFRG